MVPIMKGILIDALVEEEQIRREVLGRKSKMTETGTNPITALSYLNLPLRGFNLDVSGNSP